MIYDISQEVAATSAVFPGDTPFASGRVATMAEGASCDVGFVTMSVHVGTHADAPAHFLPGGVAIDGVSLEAYLGPARVADLPSHGPITAAEVEALDLGGVARLLLRTGSAPDPRVFNTGFAYLTPEAAEVLAARGLRLVGIDTPSMDRWDSKTLDAHKALAAGGVALLENLVLRDVPPGDYELVALPLKLRGLDASPVRAVLRTLD